jgi:hypothetical protein
MWQQIRAWSATAIREMCYRVTVTQTAPPARNVTPAMKIAVSNLVISQPLRMARLNCLTVGWPANSYLIAALLSGETMTLPRIHQDYFEGRGQML